LLGDSLRHQHKTRDDNQDGTLKFPHKTPLLGSGAVRVSLRPSRVLRELCG
jgi:hypothetical protein